MQPPQLMVLKTKRLFIVTCGDPTWRVLKFGKLVLISGAKPSVAAALAGRTPYCNASEECWRA